MIAQTLDAAKVRAALNADVAGVAVQLFGEPNAAMSSPRQLRFGTHGKIAVELVGPKAGVWCDHSSGTGGDLLDAIKLQVGGSSFQEVLEHAVALVGGSLNRDPPPPRPAAISDDKAHKIKLAKRIWNEATAPANTPVERYLINRSLALIDTDAIRYHPRCPRGADRVPAMVCAMRRISDGELVGVHRTFLAHDGQKARLHVDDPAKAMLGDAGAIMLDPFEDVTLGLHISEGIENALATRLNGWAPVWALGSAGAIERFPVLGGIEALTIMLDADDACRRAARVCAERWAAAGSEVRLIEPRRENADWNDIVKEAAA